MSEQEKAELIRLFILSVTPNDILYSTIGKNRRKTKIIECKMTKDGKKIFFISKN